MSPEKAVEEGVELSTEERVALFRRAFTRYDGKAFAESANGFSLMMMAAHRESPDLARELFPAIDTALSEIDFGKMREAVASLLDYWTAAMSRLLESAADSPVIVANLVGMVPPLANSLMKVLSTMLDTIELPPEILASALFNTLTAIDAEELGRVLSTLAGKVEALHAGNIILGGDEPRLRAVFTDLAKRVLENLDIEAAAGALSALGEDAEVMAGSLVELAARDPRTVLALCRAAFSVSNSVTGMHSAALSEMAAWPDELLAEIGDIEREGSDPAEIGRAIDSFVTFALRFREANPDVHREALTDVLRAVNTEQLELVVKGAANDAKLAALANPGIRMALQPEEVGRRVNGMLAGFNRSAGPANVAGYLSRMFGAIDSDELEKAMRTTSFAVVDAVSASAGFARSLLRTALSTAWRLIMNGARRLN